MASNARIDNEFAIGNLQNRQIDVLNKIYNSVYAGADYSKHISFNSSKAEILLKNIAQSTAKTVTSIASFYRGMNKDNEQEYKNFLNRASSNSRRVMSSLESELSQVVEVAAEGISENHKNESDNAKDIQKKRYSNEKELHNYRMSLLSEALRYVSKIGALADNFSETSNRMLQITGEYKSSVQDNRRDIINIVNEINKETGSFFNAQESYKKMTDIASSANIGDLEVLEEIAKPVLLASEGMEASTDSIAKLLGRWNTRYNFSSLAMEEMLDEIRGNTAGNNASAEATLKNLAELDNWMAYYSKGDEAKMSEMSAAISKGTSWLESMGVDTSRYTGYLKDIASGEALTNPQLIQVLNAAGISGQQAQKMFSEGSIDELYKALFLGESSIMESLEGVNVLSQALKSRDMDVNDMIDTYTAYKSANYQSLDEFTPMDSTNTSVTDDKYLGPLEAIQNKLSGIASFLSTMQENTGVISLSNISQIIAGSLAMKGLADLIFKAYPALKTGLSSLPILGKISSILGGAGTAITSGGILAAITPLLVPIAGVAAALGAGGIIVSAITDIKKSNTENFNNLIDATKDKPKDEKTMLMMTKTITPQEDGTVKTTYSMQNVSESEFNQEEHLANLEASYKQDMQNRKWTTKLVEAFTGNYSAKTRRDTNESWSSFYNGLNNEEQNIITAYMNAGMVANDNQRSFLQKNFNTIKSAHDRGYALQLDDAHLDEDKWFPRKDILGYATGTNYIHSNQLAYLHEGEAVVPKKYNPAANVTELEMLREQSKKAQEKQYQGNEESLKYVRETFEVISDIKEFLSYWREDNIKRENIKRANNRFAANSRYLAGYMTD